MSTPHLIYENGQCNKLNIWTYEHMKKFNLDFCASEVVEKTIPRIFEKIWWGQFSLTHGVIRWPWFFVLEFSVSSVSTIDIAGDIPLAMLWRWAGVGVGCWGPLRSYDF